MLRILPYLVAASFAATSSVQAADLRFNGFASIAAGKTLSEGADRNRFTGAESNAKFLADDPTNGIYDDDISFKPDTVFGLQISANLGNGLNVTGQFTGSGGEDFDANVAWAYISYDFNDHWNLQAGRQRLPLFFYSDFLDVGYAYHWMRVPQDLPAAFNDTFEGLKFAYSNSNDNWDWRFDVYGGSSNVDSESSFGTLGVNLEKILGGVAKFSNDWLQLRASYMITDIDIDDAETLPFFRLGEQQFTNDNPLTYEFAGVAAHATLGNGFVVAEYAVSAVEDPLAPDGDASGFDNDLGWYISYGHRFGDITPHITYSVSSTTYSDEMPTLTSDADDDTETWTIGIRWDFHPSAAFKFEYLTREQDSDNLIENSVGGFGDGTGQEVDLISAGFDIIF